MCEADPTRPGCPVGRCQEVLSGGTVGRYPGNLEVDTLCAASPSLVLEMVGLGVDTAGACSAVR